MFVKKKYVTLFEKITDMKSDNILNSIKNYLANETDYALMITGDWGTGKTFYFKNDIKGTLKKQGFKVLYISLYGKNNINDVKNEILLSSLSSKTELKNIISSISIGKIPYVKDLSSFIKGDSITTFLLEKRLDNKTIICLDDLERKNKNLDLTELFGFINFLVTESKCKVFIIVNENKLDEKEFSIIKEKTIGQTLVFNPNLGNVYDSIVSTYKSNNEYQKFLNKQKQVILNFLSDQKYFNLRTLIYALNQLKIVFEKSRLVSNENIVTNIVEFVLALSIEYRENRLNNKDKDRFKDFNPAELYFGGLFDTDNKNRDNKTENNNNKTDKENCFNIKNFHKKYKRKFIKVFWESIFDLVTINDFDSDKFDSEISSIDIGDEEIKNLILELSFENELKLEDKDYIDKSEKLISLAKDGKLKNIDDYYFAMYNIVRYDNLLSKDLNVLKEDIIKGAEKNTSNLKLDSIVLKKIEIDNEIYLLKKDQYYLDILKDLRDKFIKIRDEAESKQREIQAKELERKLCDGDIKTFKELLLKLKYNVLSYIDCDEFFECYN